MTFCAKHSSHFCPDVRPELYTKAERADYMAGIDRRKANKAKAERKP